MDFFPDPPEPPDDDAPDDHSQPTWVSAPQNVMPGVVPVEFIRGRSASTVVMLTEIRAFPSGLAMTLGVRVRARVGRRDLDSEVFDGPYNHDMGGDWQSSRLKWGFELADGRRVTNVDPPPWAELTHQEHSSPASPGEWLREPDHPVLTGGGVAAGRGRSIEALAVAAPAGWPVARRVPVAGPGHRDDRARAGRRAVPRSRPARGRDLGSPSDTRAVIIFTSPAVAPFDLLQSLRSCRTTGEVPLLHLAPPDADPKAVSHQPAAQWVR